MPVTLTPCDELRRGWTLHNRRSQTMHTTERKNMRFAAPLHSAPRVALAAPCSGTLRGSVAEQKLNYAAGVCYAVLCYAMPQHATMPWQPMPRHAMLCYVVQH